MDSWILISSGLYNNIADQKMFVEIFRQKVNERFQAKKGGKGAHILQIYGDVFPKFMRKLRQIDGDLFPIFMRKSRHFWIICI